MEIEEVARRDPEKIVRVHVDPLLGLREYQARYLASALGLPHKHWREFGSIAQALYQTYEELDATLAEINPLVIAGQQQFLALDGKMVIDDNSLFRHPDLAEMRDLDAETPAEREARTFGLSYIQLDGNIGCMVNGAGLAMTTMDVIKLYGGEPANFLDIGGGATSEKVADALVIILSDQKVGAVLLNIFGGITRVDEVALGILEALDNVDSSVPIVARLVGTNEEEGRKLLADAEMITASSLADAAQKAVAVARESVVE